jgi:hypothetical protein
MIQGNFLSCESRWSRKKFPRTIASIGGIGIFRYDITFPFMKKGTEVPFILLFVYHYISIILFTLAGTGS